jgi:hypothetical protein
LLSDASEGLPGRGRLFRNQGERARCDSLWCAALGANLMSVERIRPERCPDEGGREERKHYAACIDIPPEPLGLPLARYRATPPAVSAASAEGPDKIECRIGTDDQK